MKETETPPALAALPGGAILLKTNSGMKDNLIAWVYLPCFGCNTFKNQ